MRALLILCLLATACGDDKETTTPKKLRATALSKDLKGTGGDRCNAGIEGREMAEYDTSGDQVSDVRKVFMRAGTGGTARYVMICRETDLNGDGAKDVIRYYDDEGRSLREEGDRNFDGAMDQTSIYQDGRVVRKEFDDNYDGSIDHKLFYEKGEPTRAERDLAGRSTADEWKPDRWEYYEKGRMVRMGTDLDGDSRVDRWDRDQSIKRTTDASSVAGSDPEGSEG